MTPRSSPRSAGEVGRAWTYDTTTQYNRHQQRPERFSAAASYRPEPTKVLNASYRFQRDVLKQIDISGQWPLAPGWYGVGRYNYSIQDKQLLEGLAGFEYNAGCWVFRAVALRVQAAQRDSNHGIRVPARIQRHRHHRHRRGGRDPEARGARVLGQ